MINYDEKMVLNGHLVIKMGIDQIGKNFVKSMSVKKFSYLRQFIQGLRTPGLLPGIALPILIVVVPPVTPCDPMGFGALGGVMVTCL